MNSSNFPIRKRVETLTDIPGGKLGDVVKDFTDAGGDVSVTTQSDGLFTVEAIITDSSDYAKFPVSGYRSTADSK
jgi:hypothetical protein